MNKINASTISSCFSGINSDDILFIEVAANKMLNEFKEEAKVILC